MHLTDTEGIITGGLMDSFALAEFAVYVESEFGVYIPDSDLTVAKMDTLDQMAVRVMRGRATGMMLTQSTRHAFRTLRGCHHAPIRT